ncbi:aerolysin-like protein [Oryzias latipes]|uniref:aerolysin-like protein n=1 Tax=Oryzias latipes TaxID=8090 RepID=UPI0000EA1DDF|nr:aerolysin-like protein [Oryzias latipes]
MSYMSPISIVGGHGGSPFNFIGAKTGALLKKLDVCVGPTQVRSITVLMSDDVKETFGTSKGASDKMLSFDFEGDEYFSVLTLWPNNNGEYLGGIKFKTTKGNTFEAVMTNGKLSMPPTKVDVGSGMCFGVQGRSGTEVDALGFMLIKDP